jgi:hypothetical protein
MVKKTSRAMKKNRGRKGRKGRKSDVAIPANAELDEHADVIRRIGRQSFQGAVEIGRRLVLCRKLLKAQRVWLAWIKKKFGWSRKHADNLIGLYVNRGKVAKFATFGVPLSALYLLSQQHARIVKNIERCTEPGKRPLVREIKEQVHRERTVIGMPTAADRAGALAASKLVAAGLHERGIREEQRRISRGTQNSRGGQTWRSGVASGATAARGATAAPAGANAATHERGFSSRRRRELFGMARRRCARLGGLRTCRGNRSGAAGKTFEGRPTPESES